MRTSLVLSGIITAVLGVALNLLMVPFGFSWSIPFMVGGLVIILVGALAKESEGEIAPPAGYRFCSFCSTPVLLTAKRCDHCNGLQDT